MLDIRFIRQNQKIVQKACKNKNVLLDIEDILKLDKQKKTLLDKVEDLRCQKNKLGKDDINEARKIKMNLKEIEPKLKETEILLEKLMLQVPNIPMDDVPVGKNDTENQKMREWGKLPKFDFEVKDHVALGESLDIIDIKRASKVAGTRFGYLKGKLALLEMALIQYSFEVLTSQKIIKKLSNSIEKNYSDKVFVPVFPPVMIRPDVFTRMARLSPKNKEERYYFPQDDLYLIGSAEHTLGAMHMDETIPENQFPIRYVGFSTSFRREAGSYGKDTRGIFRVHQFDKIEMEVFSLPENSLKEHNFLIAIQEYLMQSLKIPYRVMMVCTGDMGKPDARQVDIEAWFPGQNKYRETHSADLMVDYQARRLKTKVKKEKGSEFIHMNDATVFAIGRTLIAIMENYQQKDGSILVPEVLKKYVNFEKIN